MQETEHIDHWNQIGVLVLAHSESGQWLDLMVSWMKRLHIQESMSQQRNYLQLHCRAYIEHLLWKWFLPDLGLWVLQLAVVFQHQRLSMMGEQRLGHQFLRHNRYLSRMHKNLWYHKILHLGSTTGMQNQRTKCLGLVDWSWVPLIRQWMQFKL